MARVESPSHSPCLLCHCHRPEAVLRSIAMEKADPPDSGVATKTASMFNVGPRIQHALSHNAGESRCVLNDLCRNPRLPARIPAVLRLF